MSKKKTGKTVRVKAGTPTCPHIKNTIKKVPQLDPKKVAEALGAEETNEVPEVVRRTPPRPGI